MQKEIRKLVLTNAVKYNGKASVGSVVGALMQEKPEFKSKIKELMKDISQEVARVNKLKLEDQEKELKSLGGAKKVEKKRRGMFDFLGIKEGDKIVTSFPPGPEKFPHIGHAKAALMNYLLAKEYKGKFVPRFEDTNPETVKKNFYDVMLENFAWLGIKWKDWPCASDYMEEYYKSAEKLIKDGEMYVCSCSQEKTSANRKKGIECECRDVKDQLSLWKEFFKAKKGSSIVRLKIDMKHKNSTMRDPAMFRINDTKHARQGNKYRVWPTYDFQNAYMDGKLKVTHRLRTKEFEMRAELQRYVQKLLGFKTTTTYEFGRFNMEGVLSSGRVIRDAIDKGKLIGWDDPRLTTIVALRRRGFLPEAIKEFVLSTGISKADSTVTWDDLIIKNKRLLDATAKRYSFVEKPKKIKIENEIGKVEVRLHPDKDYGVRKFKVGEEFYVNDKIEKGVNYRLMHLFNFKDKKFISLDHDPKLKAKLIHWIPVGQETSIEIFMDNGKWIKGLAEKNIKNVKVGEVIQFERFGFCRYEGKNKFIFTHR